MKTFDERKKAELILANDFREKQLVIEEIFSIIDCCIDLMEKKSAESTYHRICGLTLLKAKNLGLGMYSLILDGLAQEAGALARPFLEYLELLIYFRLDPNRVNEAINDKLPSAGEIAKKIEGRFKEFRSHLNDHASHSSYSFYSLNHLLEKPSFKFKKFQTMIPKVLDRNLGDLFAQLGAITIAGSKVIFTKDIEVPDELTDRIDACLLRGIKVFNYEQRLHK